MKYLFTILFLLLCFTVLPQTIVSTSKVECLNNDSIFTSADQMPQYVGGNFEMMKFIFDHFKISDQNEDEPSGGAVSIVRFVVTKKGKIENIKIVRGENDSFNKAFIEAIRQMPDWIPGKQKGIPVNMFYTLPLRVRFQQ